MKLFAKISSWVLIVVGLLSIVGAIVMGVVGLFARIAVMRSAGRLVGAVNVYFTMVFWIALFAGLLLVGIGLILAMMVEVLKTQKIHAQEHAAMHATPPIILPETMPDIKPAEPAKPTRSRKIAG